MQKALIEMVVPTFLLGMLLIACATTSSTQTSKEMATPDATMDKTVAAPMSAEDQEARRQYEIERNRFMYEDVFFAKNKYRLDDQARDLLDWKANWLLAHPYVKVVIEGHCGEGGSAQGNMALGLRRAGEV